MTHRLHVAVHDAHAVQPLQVHEDLPHDGPHHRRFPLLLVLWPAAPTGPLSPTFCFLGKFPAFSRCWGLPDFGRCGGWQPCAERCESDLLICMTPGVAAGLEGWAVTKVPAASPVAAQDVGRQALWEHADIAGQRVCQCRVRLVPPDQPLRACAENMRRNQMHDMRTFIPHCDQGQRSAPQASARCWRLRLGCTAPLKAPLYCSAPLVNPPVDCSAVNSPRYLAPLSRADGFRDIRLHTYCSTCRPCSSKLGTLVQDETLHDGTNLSCAASTTSVCA